MKGDLLIGNKPPSRSSFWSGFSFSSPSVDVELDESLPKIVVIFMFNKFAKDIYNNTD